MELEKQINLAKLIYENLTGKKVGRAKEETLATIFQSVHDGEIQRESDKLRAETQQATAEQRGFPATKDYQDDIQSLYENQESIKEQVEQIEQNSQEVSESIVAMEVKLNQRIKTINATLQNIVNFIKNLNQQPEEPEQPEVPLEITPPKPAPKPEPTAIRTTTQEQPTPAPDFTLEK